MEKNYQDFMNEFFISMYKSGVTEFKITDENINSCLSAFKGVLKSRDLSFDELISSHKKENDTDVSAFRNLIIYTIINDHTIGWTSEDNKKLLFDEKLISSKSKKRFDKIVLQFNEVYRKLAIFNEKENEKTYTL